MDIGDLRTPYNAKSNLFLESNIEPKDPFDLFHKWFLDAKKCPTIVEPNAMCLATANKEGKPSARFVLCKGYGKEGFKFFTHYTSRKGEEMDENPHVALTFYWDCLCRSVRIEGKVEKLPFAEADKYFQSRPYQSQIGALCSHQSKPIAGRDDLTEKEAILRKQYKEGEVPRPKFW